MAVISIGSVFIKSTLPSFGSIQKAAEILCLNCVVLVCNVNTNLLSHFLGDRQFNSFFLQTESVTRGAGGGLEISKIA